MLIDSIEVTKAAHGLSRARQPVTTGGSFKAIFIGISECAVLSPYLMLDGLWLLLIPITSEVAYTERPGQGRKEIKLSLF